MTSPPVPLRLAVLISGGGRTLLNLHEIIQRGNLPATIERVISSRSKATGVARVQKAGLSVTVLDRNDLGACEFQNQLTHTLLEFANDSGPGEPLICMAGFLSLWRIPVELIGRVINIHPALLPDFGGPGMYGHHVHEAVLAAGRSESGCTVHFCDNVYDHGPIIVQRRVPVLPGDTPDLLAERVFAQECIAYPEAIRMLSNGHVRLEGGRAVFRQ